MTAAYVNEETERDLMTSFEKSAAMVQQSFERFDESFARPTVKWFIDSFQANPVRTTFLATFAALILLPVISFVGFSFFIYATSISLALAIAIAGASMVVVMSGTVLLAVIAIALFISTSITILALLGYAAARFITLVQHGGPRAGVLEWTQEIKGHISQSTPILPAEEKEETEAHDTEPETVVSTPTAEPVKDEQVILPLLEGTESIKSIS